MSQNKVGELIPAPRYEPATEIVAGQRPQVQRYVRTILAAATRLRRMMRKLFVSAEAPTATDKLFLVGGLHSVELFKNVLSAIEERGEDIEEGLLVAEMLGRDSGYN